MMRTLIGAVLCLAASLAGKPVLADEPTTRIELVQLPGGGEVKVIRGPVLGGETKATAPAAPAPERVIAAAPGMVWLVGEDRLTACWVQRTSYVNGYRIRCLDD